MPFNLCIVDGDIRIFDGRHEPLFVPLDGLPMTIKGKVLGAVWDLLRGAPCDTISFRYRTYLDVMRGMNFILAGGTHVGPTDEELRRAVKLAVAPTAPISKLTKNLTPRCADAMRIVLEEISNV